MRGAAQINVRGRGKVYGTVEEVQKAWDAGEYFQIASIFGSARHNSDFISKAEFETLGKVNDFVYYIFENGIYAKIAQIKE
jgi:hypothetical protein